MSDETTAAATPRVAVKDLSFSYGALRALEHVDLSVAPGEVCCVLGPNGAGKSTLGAVLAGALVTGPGTVTFDGQDVSERPLHQRAQRGVAYIPEGGAVFPSLTVTENLCLGMKGVSRRKRAEVVDQASSFFSFLGSRRDARAGMLSGGEQQMLSLARILVVQPKLAVVDELSHGLAPAIVEQLFETVAASKGTTTFVLIEQYLGRAYALADVILVLSQGSPAYWGTAADTTVDELERLYLLHEAAG